MIPKKTMHLISQVYWSISLKSKYDLNRSTSNQITSMKYQFIQFSIYLSIYLSIFLQVSSMFDLDFPFLNPPAFLGYPHDELETTIPYIILLTTIIITIIIRKKKHIKTTIYIYPIGSMYGIYAYIC